jgi:hypothetical protein
MKTGTELIAEERKRQLEVEGWTSENDDNYLNNELADAAICYLIDPEDRTIETLFFPFAKKWWKPSPENRVRELVKAGALIAAEIDRLNRLQIKIK